MILEALHYALTWPLTPGKFRPFIRSSVSLWSRANRCAKAWREHEQHCHAAILSTVGALKSRRTCVVLGSGLLRDVPILELSRAFDTVVLVDLVHLAGVRSRIAMKGLKNVRFIHRDLSGLEEQKAGKPLEPLAFLRQVPYLDLVISANLLSQIAIGAGRVLEKQGMAEAEAEPLLHRLVEAHVAGLSALPCPVLLLTDTSFDIVNREGAVEDRTDLLHGLSLPPAEAEWTWPVAPLGEISKNYALRHHVAACRLNMPGVLRRQ